MSRLIPLSYLNEACFLSLNNDTKKFDMVLKMAQEDLKSVLSTEFYSEIVSQYPNSLTTDNDTLYEGYIKDFLAWQAYAYYLKFANVNDTPTGIRQFTDDNSSIASDVKMYSLEKNVVQRANEYKGRMISFLKLEQSKDSTKYPLWTDRCDSYGLSFAITAIDGKTDTIIRINKAVTKNE